MIDWSRAPQGMKGLSSLLVLFPLLVSGCHKDPEDSSLDVVRKEHTLPRQGGELDTHAQAILTKFLPKDGAGNFHVVSFSENPKHLTRTLNCPSLSETWLRNRSHTISGPSFIWSRTFKRASAPWARDYSASRTIYAGAPVTCSLLTVRRPLGLSVTVFVVQRSGGLPQ